MCRDAGRAISAAPIDVAFVGIGENGHLAFNDPPADFETREPYLVVTLDEACRRQQVGEGWFASLEDVPTLAISMSCRQILASTEILVIVPDARKADAVRAACEGAVTPLVPASLLQEHDRVTVYLDPPAASRLARPPHDARGAGLNVAAPIRHLRWYIGGLLFLSTVINYIDRQTLNVLGPLLKTEYGWSNQTFSYVLIAFRVAYADRSDDRRARHRSLRHAHRA